MNLGRKIISIISIVQESNESPKFQKRSECDNCHKITTELYDFNNLKLCKQCFENQKKRFPLVKV